jgi:hypothetical protein
VEKMRSVVSTPRMRGVVDNYNGGGREFKYVIYNIL